jgi:hypothetical protein
MYKWPNRCSQLRYRASAIPTTGTLAPVQAYSAAPTGDVVVSPAAAVAIIEREPALRPANSQPRKWAKTFAEASPKAAGPPQPPSVGRRSPSLKGMFLAAITVFYHTSPSSLSSPPLSPSPPRHRHHLHHFYHRHQLHQRH